MNQEKHGLVIEVHQDPSLRKPGTCRDHEFVRDLGIWEPVIVERQCEKDYLEALALLTGRDTTGMIYVEYQIDGKLSQETPPTWIRIPQLPD